MMDVDVLIVGGGPVGLYLGCLLSKTGHSFRILEARTEPVDHSRSIGIHPPLLISMERIGLAERIIADGARICRGHGYWNGRRFGAMDFSRLPGPYRFVLSLPQTRTEVHLRDRLNELAPGALEQGVRVESLRSIEDGVVARTGRSDGDAAGRTWKARVVIGCDGKYSTVRSEAGFDFEGAAYPDRYLMGDFAESTSLGTDAALCLGAGGLVESFPLPSGERRWVVRLAGTDGGDDLTKAGGERIARRIGELVHDRTPFEIDATTASMTSAFGVERFEARPMAEGRVLLAGDAAHVVSPIGGQGMNLGWLDADAVGAALGEYPLNVVDMSRIADRYASERRRMFVKARRRAEFNMWMGRARTTGVRGAVASALKAVTARLILVPGIRAASARQFTMHGLGARSG